MKRKGKRKVKRKADKGRSFFWYVGQGLLYVLKIPYYVFLGIRYIIRKISKKRAEKAVFKKRERMVAKYEDLKVLDTVLGKYEKWIDKAYNSDSQIGIILGARGSGKTAFGIKFLENYHVKNKKKCFAIGFNKNDLPSWISGVKEVSEIENDSYVLIDEGGVLFNSRSSMSSANKLLSQLMLIARHKNISILFISQNSSNLEVNILRQADFLVLKPSSLLQKDFERKIIQNIYNKSKAGFEKFSSDKGLTYIYSGAFSGFVSNPLPSFWKENLSKGFR